MKKVLTIMLGLVLVLCSSGLILAVEVDDSGDSPIGPIDLISADIELYDRGDTTLLKGTVAVDPADPLPAAVIFEVDVDNSTGTGGSRSTIGVPVTPCVCKSEPGFDIAISIFNRAQGKDSGSALAASCTDNQGECGTARQAGEWYALNSISGQPVRALGILRGIADPIPLGPDTSFAQGVTQDSYTFPYSFILAYANQWQKANCPAECGSLKPFNFKKARSGKCTGTETLCLKDGECTAPATCDDTYADAKWQVSVWYDEDAPTTDDDDVGDGISFFNINDWAPDVGKGSMTKSTGSADLTYCEGNFDGDSDVDGTDASAFKNNFGRSGFKNPCPRSGPNF